jgi:rhodanese-related sulfurtransferase
METFMLVLICIRNDRFTDVSCARIFFVVGRGRRVEERKNAMHPNTIERTEILAALASGQPLVLLEALDEPYYQEAHLPGAWMLPLRRLEAIARGRLADKRAAIVVYCASITCKNSEIAARALGALGYENVRIYPGGKADWIEAGLPVERGREITGAGQALEVAS